MLRRTTWFLSIVISCVSAGLAPAVELVLAENGQSAYQIVVAENASPSTRHGAEELQMFSYAD